MQNRILVRAHYCFAEYSDLQSRKLSKEIHEQQILIAAVLSHG